MQVDRNVWYWWTKYQEQHCHQWHDFLKRWMTLRNTLKKKKPSKNEDEPPLGLHSSRRPWFDSWVRRICWRWDMLPTPVFLCFPGGLAGKEFTCHAGDLGLIPGLGRSPGEGTGYPLQDSGLENSRGYTVHGVAESDTTEWLSLSL